MDKRAALIIMAASVSRPGMEKKAFIGAITKSLSAAGKLAKGIGAATKGGYAAMKGAKGLTIAGKLRHAGRGMKVGYGKYKAGLQAAQAAAANGAKAAAAAAKGTGPVYTFMGEAAKPTSRFFVNNAAAGQFIDPNFVAPVAPTRWQRFTGGVGNVLSKGEGFLGRAMTPMFALSMIPGMFGGGGDAEAPAEAAYAGQQNYYGGAGGYGQQNLNYYQNNSPYQGNSNYSFRN